MELSLFLGKVVGAYLLIVGIAYMVRVDLFQEALREFTESPAFMVFGAVLSLIIGLLMVFGHNVWEWNWRVVVTIVGYLSLLKGIMNLFYPEWARYFAEMYRDKTAYTITGGVTIFLGLYLLYSTML